MGAVTFDPPRGLYTRLYSTRNGSRILQLSAISPFFARNFFPLGEKNTKTCLLASASGTIHRFIVTSPFPVKNFCFTAIHTSVELVLTAAKTPSLLWITCILVATVYPVSETKLGQV